MRMRKVCITIFIHVYRYTDIIIILFCEIVNVVTVSLLYNMLQVCHVARHLHYMSESPIQLFTITFQPHSKVFNCMSIKHQKRKGKANFGSFYKPGKNGKQSNLSDIQWVRVPPPPPPPLSVEFDADHAGIFLLWTCLPTLPVTFASTARTVTKFRKSKWNRNET